MARDQVFVCYSHKDRKWADRVVAYLPAFSREYEIVLYDDVASAGEDWRSQTRTELMQASVAILLISADFLASPFFTEINVFPMLLGRETGAAVVIPLIIRPTDWHHGPWLQQLQVLPSTGTPMSKLPPDRVDSELSHLAERVREAIAQVQYGRRPDDGWVDAGLPPILSPEAPQVLQERWVFISHAHSDGDFAELLKLRIEEAGFRAWVDADRLPVGFDWREGIDDAVRKSVAIVAVISPRSAISEYVTYEWAFAYGAGIQVIPVVIEQTKMHPRLDVLQHLDFTNRRGRPWDILITALRDAAEKKNDSH